MAGRTYRITRGERTTRSEVPVNVISGGGVQGSSSPPVFDGKLDFSISTNSMYVPLVLGGLG